MATADTSAFPSPFLEDLSPTKNIMHASGDTEAGDTQSFFVQEQHFLQDHLARGEQGQMMGSSSFVCEWMPTTLRLPSQDSQQREIYLCLPVHLSEASYFKQNEETEECKDDGYCSTTATQLRLMALDHYLSVVSPLALSTQKLLSSAPAVTGEHDSCTQLPHTSFNNYQKKLPQHRRSKHERQCQMPMHPSRPPNHRLITSTNSGRVINVLQGEIAHCTPTQADILVSDDATTCHIVALWSHYLGPGEGEQTNGAARSHVLTTMTHIDGVGYEMSIRDAVSEHHKYHSMHSPLNMGNVTDECKDSCTYNRNGIIEMSIHVMGGFNDDDGSSIKITDNVLQTFETISNEFNDYFVSRNLPSLRMTLETCAVASANDDGNGCPLGRGLAIEVATGNVFLAEVENVNMHESLGLLPSAVMPSSNGSGVVGDVQLFDTSAKHVSAQGPGVILRSTRLWASAFHPRSRKRESRLNVIHRPSSDYIFIEPFFFVPHSNAKGLLECGDEELLQITSTSPEVEKPNFVSNVRQSLTYMNGTTSSKVFATEEPIKFQRVGLNGWVRINEV
ncbi:hypothetical protein ACHAXR_010265 [Thalassiosira sp. AJA248-18]